MIQGLYDHMFACRFVWIMGTAMRFSFEAQVRRSTPRKKMFLRVLRRSLILFALGLLINSSNGLARMSGLLSIHK